jgi:hypothetical protein
LGREKDLFDREDFGQAVFSIGELFIKRMKQVSSPAGVENAIAKEEALPM